MSIDRGPEVSGSGERASRRRLAGDAQTLSCSECAGLASSREVPILCRCRPESDRAALWGGMDGRSEPDIGRAHELVFAIAHEVGNHLGGIRMQAHLLDEDLDARSLAAAAVNLDELAGRAGPLLALLRPILSEDWRASGTATWPALLQGVVQQLEDEGTRGAVLSLKPPADEALEAPGFEWLHSLLIALLGATLASLPRQGALTIGLEVRIAETAVFVEDDGPAEDLSPAAALRGRPLALAIARELVGRAGGRIEAARTAERTRVELVFPQPA